MRVQPNRYEVCPRHEALKQRACDWSQHPQTHVPGAAILVDLSPKHEGVPPPDPRLLALHAACARVAHMSDAIRFHITVEPEAEEAM